MGFPNMPLGEGIYLSRLPDGKAIGVRGYTREFQMHMSTDYVEAGDFGDFRIPTEFRVDLRVDMLALQTVMVDLGQDIWTPDATTPLPQPRLGEGRY